MQDKLKNIHKSKTQIGRVAVLSDDLKKGEQGYEKLYTEYNSKTQALITTEKAKARAATPRNSN